MRESTASAPPSNTVPGVVRLAELTLVMPAYNEAEGIVRVLEEARAKLVARCDRFEIVVVDDGSTDATAELLTTARATIPELTILTQPRNSGYAVALTRGLLAARFDPVLYIDADGQFDVADLDRAAPLLVEGVDCVAGYRAHRADRWPRKVASAGFNLLARVAVGTRGRDVDCAFKLFRKSFLASFPFTSRGFLIDTELFARARRDGRRIVQLPVTHRPRLAGSSTVRLGSIWRSARELLALRRQLAEEASRAAVPRPADRRSWRAAAVAFAPVAVALALGLFAQGWRGLGEPDEGRNAQIAATMLASGDWLVPRLDGHVYLDKPPLTFWLVAASLRAAGQSEFAARLPLALAFALTAALIGRLGARLWGPSVGVGSAWAYALSVGPFVGAGVLTPDALLVLASTATAICFWRATHDTPDHSRFWLLAGAAAGVGLLTKGTAMLVMAAPLFVAESVRRRGLRWLRAPGPWLALMVALGVGLPWYLWIARSLPGAASYFVSNQVVGRLAEQGYQRNSEWWKVFTLYLPVLVIGALPGSLGWPAKLLRGLRERRRSGRFAASDEGRFVALWVALPLALFCAASSRLPLYLLPLFAPLALIAGRSLAEAWTLARGAAWRRGLVAVGALWLIALGALKVVAATRVDYRDGRRLASWIAGVAAQEAEPVWAVDADLHSLPFYGIAVPSVSTSRSERYPLYEPLPALAEELVQRRPAKVLLVTSKLRLGIVRETAVAHGYRCEVSEPGLRLAALECRLPERRRAPRRRAGLGGARGASAGVS